MIRFRSARHNNRTLPYHRAAFTEFDTSLRPLHKRFFNGVNNMQYNSHIMAHTTHFAARLRQIRIANDLTQEALAALVNCSVQTVRAFEHGRRRPSREMAVRLADVLKIEHTERETFLQEARTPITLAKANTPTTTSITTPPSLAPHVPIAQQPLDTLFGRASDLQRLHHLQIKERRRLVSVLGPGGTGKSSLALHASTQLTPEFEDRSVFVPLATITDASNIPFAIAETLNHTLPANQDAETALCAYLSNYHMLLVLDNLEQLLSITQGDRTCAFLSRLLQEAPRLQLLVTSRERLRLRLEWVHELAGLEVPNSPHMAIIARTASVQLFLERARQALPHFALTADNYKQVTQICQRLEGLPLAIELAAAQLAFLPLDTIATRLDQALTLLEGHLRDQPERQRTMRAAIAWSYELLNPDERIFFRRLAVFNGTFTLEACEHICSDDTITVSHVLNLLRHLIDQSLLLFVDGRYRLLETVRQFALDRLIQHNELTIIRNRHSAYYIEIAEQAYDLMRSAEQVAWITRFTLDYPNFRDAMRWQIEVRNYRAVAQLNWSLWLFLWMRGHFNEGRGWLNWLLAQGDDVPPESRALAQLTAGVLAYGQGAYDEALAYLDECFAWYQTHNDAIGLARSTAMRGLTLAGQHQHEQAIKLLAEGVERYIAVGDIWGAALTLIYWAVIPLNQGDFASALALTERALPLTRQTGDRVGIYTALYNLASVAQSRGSYTEAARLFCQATELSFEMGDASNISYCLTCLANVAAKRGRISLAARLWGAAESYLEQSEAANYAYRPKQADILGQIQAARRRIDSQHWEAAWLAGRNATPTEVIALAQQSAQDTPNRAIR